MLSLKPSSLLTSHVGQNDGTGPSPRILSQVSGQATGPAGQNRLMKVAEEDFEAFTGATGLSGIVGRVSYACAAAAEDLTVDGGVLIGGAGPLDVATGVATLLDDKPSQMEARVSVPVAATVFAGFATARVAANDQVVTGGDVVDADCIGIRVINGEVSIVSNAGGAGLVVHETIDTDTLNLNDGGYHKLGVTYTQRGRDGSLKAYVDGELVASLTMAALELAANNVPLNTPLSAVVSVNDALATDGIDWIYALRLGK